MKEQNIIQPSDHEKEFENLNAIGKTKLLSGEEQTRLLNEIRSGNRKPIERLVNSWETIILSIAKPLGTEKVTFKEMLEAGKKELLKLAEHEINSKTSERFFRFGAWCVRQAILKKIKSEAETEQVNKNLH